MCSVLFFNSIVAQNDSFSLGNFYSYDAEIAYRTDSIFGSLDDRTRVAQMIVTSAGELGKSDAEVRALVENKLVGGVVYLKGSKNEHKSLIRELKAVNEKAGGLPLINSMDAEPSLFNGRVKGTSRMMKSSDINTLENCDSIAHLINETLLELGIHQNFAPVCDLSKTNAAITNRSFGSNADSVIALSKQFISTTQSDNIVATAKHFPGHGLVKGDTHKQSVFIDGELQELPVYKPLIEAGVVSIMVAHITIKNNEDHHTSGLPATCSKPIVTGLLKEELGFKGIVITDALNIMKAVTVIDKAPLKASMAGCDMILMPIDEAQTIDWILEEMEKNATYKKEVYKSVKKILRLKICLNLI